MLPTPHAQAILLLTASLGRADPGDARPLSNSEWARFAIWLKDHKLAPASLLDTGWRELVAGWTDPAVPLVRLEALLNRSAALGLALEKWQRAGLWVLTRSDAEYPDRLKKRLRAKAPAALFGCGNRGLLNAGGIAVVGSRKADDEDLRFAEDLGRQAAEQGRTIVSGGARGIDQCAMLGALESEGMAVGVLADSLLRSATSAKYRKYLVSNDLALVTPFNPEARFHVGSAMSRNKYIYCLADAGVAVCSKPERGGTWNGAVENLKATWVPLWVKRNDSPVSGNSALVTRGARWLPLHLRPDSFDELAESQASPVAGAGRMATDGTEVMPASAELADGGLSPAKTDAACSDDLYWRFLRWMEDATTSEPIIPDDIVQRLGLPKKLVQAWLKRGTSEKRVKRLARPRPVRYQAADVHDGQGSLLPDEA